MLAKIEIDRLKGKTFSLTKQIEKLEKEANAEAVELQEEAHQTQHNKTKTAKLTPFPEERENPWESQEIEKFHMRDGTTLYKT